MSDKVQLDRNCRTKGAIFLSDRFVIVTLCPTVFVQLHFVRHFFAPTMHFVRPFLYSYSLSDTFLRLLCILSDRFCTVILCPTLFLRLPYIVSACFCTVVFCPTVCTVLHSTFCLTFKKNCPSSDLRT